jgi:hypothetical protein
MSLDILHKAEHLALLLLGFGLGTAVAVVAAFYAFKYVIKAQAAEDKEWRDSWKEETGIRETKMLEAVAESRKYPAQVANIYGPISTSVGKMEKQLHALVQKLSGVEILARRVEDLALQMSLIRERVERLESKDRLGE